MFVHHKIDELWLKKRFESYVQFTLVRRAFERKKIKCILGKGVHQPDIWYFHYLNPRSLELAGNYVLSSSRPLPSHSPNQSINSIIFKMAAAGSFQHKTSSSCIYLKELWAGFEGTIQARCPIYNNNLENFILSIFSIASHGQEMCQSIRTHKLKLFHREPTN